MSNRSSVAKDWITSGFLLLLTTEKSPRLLTGLWMGKWTAITSLSTISGFERRLLHHIVLFSTRISRLYSICSANRSQVRLSSLLQHNVWLDDALDRAKQLYLSHYRSMPKSLERATAHRLMRAMFKDEERFIEPSPQAIERLTLPVVREAVMRQLVAGNMEVSDLRLSF